MLVGYPLKPMNVAVAAFTEEVVVIAVKTTGSSMKAKMAVLKSLFNSFPSILLANVCSD